MLMASATPCNVAPGAIVTVTGSRAALAVKLDPSTAPNRKVSVPDPTVVAALA